MRLQLCVLFFAALVLTACGSAEVAPAEPVTLRIAGSTSLRPTLNDLAAAYQAGHPQTVVEVLGGGTAIGIQALRGQEIDLAAVSWRADDEEVPAI